MDSRELHAEGFGNEHVRLALARVLAKLVLGRIAAARSPDDDFIGPGASDRHLFDGREERDERLGIAHVEDAAYGARPDLPIVHPHLRVCKPVEPRNYCVDGLVLEYEIALRPGERALTVDGPHRLEPTIEGRCNLLICRKRDPLIGRRSASEGKHDFGLTDGHPSLSYRHDDLP